MKLIILRSGPVTFWKVSVFVIVCKVHTYILRRPQNFVKSPPIICPMYCQSNNWWRYRKILLPSQNIWTLKSTSKQSGIFFQKLWPPQNIWTLPVIRPEPSSHFPLLGWKTQLAVARCTVMRFDKFSVRFFRTIMFWSLATKLSINKFYWTLKTLKSFHQTKSCQNAPLCLEMNHICSLDCTLLQSLKNLVHFHPHCKFVCILQQSQI